MRAEARTWVAEHTPDETLGRLMAPLLVGNLVGSNQPREAADYVLQYPEQANLERNLPLVFVRWASLDVDEVDAYIKEKGIEQSIVDAYQRELKRLIDGGVRTERTRVSEDGGEGGVQ